MLIQDYLDICDPVLTFDRFMGEIELEKYLKNIPQHYTGRFRYAPVSMLKTVLFGFMANGYISLRELEDQCKINLRFMYLMDYQAPSYRTFGYFINKVLAGLRGQNKCHLSMFVLGNISTAFLVLSEDGNISIHDKK